MRTDLRWRWRFLGTLLTATLAAREAAAISKEACIESHESAQVLQRKGQLRAARQSLAICSHETCPRILRMACAQWLEELEASTPTVVIEARDAGGQPTADVRVTIDGAPLLERLDGRAIQVDPGEHTFRFEASGGARRELRIVVPEGRKNWPIVADFADRRPSDARDPRDPRDPHDSRVELIDAQRLAAEQSRLTVGYVVGGIGIAALATGTVFGLLAISASNDVVCSRPCLEKDARGAPNAELEKGNEAFARAKTFALVSDVAFGAGIIGVGIGTYLLLTTHAPTAKAKETAAPRTLPRLLPTLVPSGAGLLLEGRL